MPTQMGNGPLSPQNVVVFVSFPLLPPRPTQNMYLNRSEFGMIDLGLGIFRLLRKFCETLETLLFFSVGEETRQESHDYAAMTFRTTNHFLQRLEC